MADDIADLPSAPAKQKSAPSGASRQRGGIGARRKPGEPTTSGAGSSETAANRSRQRYGRRPLRG